MIAEWLPHTNRCCMHKWCPTYSACSHSKIWSSQKNQCIKGFGDTNVLSLNVTVSNVKVMYFGKNDNFCPQHQWGLRVTDGYWLTTVSFSTQMKNCVQWMTNNLKSVSRNTNQLLLFHELLWISYLISILHLTATESNSKWEQFMSGTVWLLQFWV